MRAARFHQWGAVPVAEDVAEPARGAGEVLVRVQAAAVAHLDVTVATGGFGLKPSLPYIGGAEGAGVVLEAEAGSGIAPGAQVMLRGGGLGVLRDGTWAERVSVPPKAVTVLAPPLPPEVAATFFVPATTAYVARAEGPGGRTGTGRAPRRRRPSGGGRAVRHPTSPARSTRCGPAASAAARWSSRTAQAASRLSERALQIIRNARVASRFQRSIRPGLVRPRERGGLKP